MSINVEHGSKRERLSDVCVGVMMSTVAREMYLGKSC